MIKKAFILIAAMFLLAGLMALSGCALTPQGDLVRTVIRDKGAESADTTLQNAEWLLCNAVTAGSVRRAYGNNPTKAAAYRTFCNNSVNETVILPPDIELVQ